VLPGRAAVLPAFPVARRRRMFHPPANAPHAAVAYRTTALDARRQDRAGGPGRFFKIYKFDDCQIIENNNIQPHNICLTKFLGAPQRKSDMLTLHAP
jgi:hypothetical protein